MLRKINSPSFAAIEKNVFWAGVQNVMDPDVAITQFGHYVKLASMPSVLPRGSLGLLAVQLAIGLSKFTKAEF